MSVLTLKRTAQSVVILWTWYEHVFGNNCVVGSLRFVEQNEELLRDSKGLR